jgi:hypothetical protein
MGCGLAAGWQRGLTFSVLSCAFGGAHSGEALPHRHAHLESASKLSFDADKNKSRQR